MEIHNHGKNLKVHFPANPKANSNQAAGGGEAGKSVDRTEQIKPLRLLDRLEGDVKVRERLLVEIEAKIQAGDYFTRAAAVDAAQEIFNS
jgi:hypothetical protein